MAGLTRTFPFKPPRISLSSFDSNRFVLRLCNPSFLVNCPDQFSSRSSSISVRYKAGGGGYYQPSLDASRSNQVSYGDDDGDDDDEGSGISTIRSATVRLLDQHQNMLGVMSKNEAIQMAEDAELDLVVLSPDSDPPVVRLMDYDKYRYEVQKKNREQHKRSTAKRKDLKELKMSYNIDVHDYAVRLKAALKFIKEGDKVKVYVNLKGRQNQFRNNAIELLRRFQNDVGELATQETINLHDKNMFLVLVPNKAIEQKAQELQKKSQSPVANDVSAGEPQKESQRPVANEVSASEPQKESQRPVVNEVSAGV